MNTAKKQKTTRTSPSTKTKLAKERMLKYLTKELGVVTHAARKAKVDRTHHYIWLKDDPVYAKKVLDIEDIALDETEGQLHKLIKDGSERSIHFHLKTRGKKRGYVERIENEDVGDTSKVILSEEGSKLYKILTPDQKKKFASELKKDVKT